MTGKKFLDKLLGNKILWTVVSLLASVVLWMYVATNEQVERIAELPNINIVFVGEEALRERGFVITDVDTLSVNLVIRGTSRTVLKLTSSNVTAQIDVSAYNRARPMRLNYDIIYPTGVDKSEISSVEKSVENVNFTIDQIIRKSVEVKIETRGTYAADYINEEPTADPQTVWLSGASEELRDVDHALVTLDFSELSHTIESDYSYTLIDAAGNTIEYESGSDTTITREQDSVFVRLPILMLKEVNLAVDFIEGGGATGIHGETRISPDKVTIAGDPDVVKAVNRIVLGTVDLASFASTFNREYDIIYPDNVVKISGETTAKANVTIIGLENRRITTNNIVVTGTPSGLEATLVTTSLEVLIRAPAGIVSQIQPENIRGEVDLAASGGMSAGTRSITPRRISIDGYPQAGVVYQHQYMVVVTIEPESTE